MIDGEIKDRLLNIVNELLDNLKLEAKINIEEENDALKVELDGENLSLLIGKYGSTIGSFEIFLNVAINKSNDNRVKIYLDVCNYRNKREDYLNKLAEQISNTVIKTKKEVMLDPLPAYERKVIHIALANNKFIKTYSEGEGVNRRVIVALKDDLPS